MMRTIFAMYMIFCLCFSAMAQQKKVTFTGKTPKKGSVASLTRTFQGKMTMTIKLGGKVFQAMQEERSQERQLNETVLESSNTAVTKVKVEYEKARISAGDPMTGTPPQTMDEPVAGHIYIVEAKKGTISVTYEQKGMTPTQEEIEIVTKDYKGLGKKDPLQELLAKKTVKLGETIKMSAEQAKALLGGEDENLTIEECSLTLKATREASEFQCAVFDTIIKMSGSVPKLPTLKMTINLKGETVVAIENCLPITMHLEGDMAMQDSQQDPRTGQAFEFVGEGTMVMDQSATYELK